MSKRLCFWEQSSWLRNHLCLQQQRGKGGGLCLSVLGGVFWECACGLLFLHYSQPLVGSCASTDLLVGVVCAEKRRKLCICRHLLALSLSLSPLSLLLASLLLINHFSLIAPDVNTSPELRSSCDHCRIHLTSALRFGMCLRISNLDVKYFQNFTELINLDLWYRVTEQLIFHKM